MNGIRAELVFPDADDCPVADASATIEGTLEDVSWTRGDGETVVEQVKSDCEVDPFEEVFDYGSQAVYEFEREATEPCICEAIERAIGPVTESYARHGDLYVVVHTNDVDDLGEVLRDLREEFGSVGIEYLVQGREGEVDEADLVPVDVRRLTERQREVLATAHEMGYFEYPRGANASEVAAELGIEPSTFTEHLNAAQSKILDELTLQHA